jgi:O-antigen ligase
VLLARYGQSDGRVFNFHNTYLQFAVDVGVIGAVVLFLTIAAAVLAFCRRYVVAPTVPMTFFFVFFVLSVGRTMTEVMLAPFATQCLMFFFCMAYAFWRPTPGWGEDEAYGAPPSPSVYPYPIPQGSPYPVSLHRMRAPIAPTAAP